MCCGRSKNASQTSSNKVVSIQQKRPGSAVRAASAHPSNSAGKSDSNSAVKPNTNNSAVKANNNLAGMPNKLVIPPALILNPQDLLADSSLKNAGKPLSHDSVKGPVLKKLSGKLVSGPEIMPGVIPSTDNPTHRDVREPSHSSKRLVSTPSFVLTERKAVVPPPAPPILKGQQGTGQLTPLDLNVSRVHRLSRRFQSSLITIAEHRTNTNKLPGTHSTPEVAAITPTKPSLHVSISVSDHSNDPSSPSSEGNASPTAYGIDTGANKKVFSTLQSRRANIRVVTSLQPYQSSCEDAKRLAMKTDKADSPVQSPVSAPQVVTTMPLLQNKLSHNPSRFTYVEGHTKPAMRASNSSGSPSHFLAPPAARHRRVYSAESIQTEGMQPPRNPAASP